MNSSMDRIEDFINYNELIDLPLVGRKYTLSNNRERLVKSKIDHFLILKEWDEHFDHSVQLALTKRISDHSPIKLFSNELN